MFLQQESKVLPRVNLLCRKFWSPEASIGEISAKNRRVGEEYWQQPRWLWGSHSPYTYRWILYSPLIMDIDCLWLDWQIRTCCRLKTQQRKFPETRSRSPNCAARSFSLMQKEQFLSWYLKNVDIFFEKWCYIASEKVAYFMICLFKTWSSSL